MFKMKVMRLVVAASAAGILLLLAACGGGDFGIIERRVEPPIQASESIDNMLTELDALEAPESVNTELFQQLKTGLREALISRGDGKIVSTPPTGDPNQVNDLTATHKVSVTYTLSWHYRNLGDYDQNGSVGISDITPIAIHFNETYEPEDVNCLAAVIDGSGNCVIDISDITAIAENFGTVCAEYAVEYATDAEGQFSEVTRFEMAEATGDGRLEFSVPFVPEEGKLHVRVVPYDAEGEPGVPGTPTEITGEPPTIHWLTPEMGFADKELIFITFVTGIPPFSYAWDFGGGATPNTSDEAYPVVTLGEEGEYDCSLTVSNFFGVDSMDFTLAVLPVEGQPPSVVSVSPTEVVRGTEVTFTAEVVGHAPFEYEWDFGGGTEPNESTDAQPTVIIGNDGEYDAALKVSSPYGGCIHRFTLTIHYHEWFVETVDSEGLAGFSGTSIALDSSNRLHIAYIDYTPKELKLGYCDGSKWNIETIGGGAYDNVSLVLDALDNPCISYYASHSRGLEYAHYDGSQWLVETVDGPGSQGEYSSLKLDSSQWPHISYYDCINKDLKYAYYDDLAWHVQLVDSAGEVGENSSLVLDSSDNPHISYYDDTNDDLKYAYFDGSSWHIEIVDNGEHAGWGSSLVLDSSGYPHISYRVWPSLTYAYHDGIAWRIETVDSENQADGFTSLALDPDDHLYIAYYANHNLMYAHFDGASWRLETVDHEGDVGAHASLALDSLNRPHISYHDDANHDLKYATYY